VRPRPEASALGRIAGLLLSCCWASAGCDRLPATWVEPHTGLRLVRIAAGEFEMGSPADEAGREAQEVLHRVRITHPYYLGATEVTQAQWAAVVGTRPSSFATCGGDCPVERVSWNDVQVFLRELGRISGMPFRLPTEAEWEYACRAGSQEAFHTGASLQPTQANIDGDGEADSGPPHRAGSAPTPVAAFAPNAFGLFDMHGNVWEWTADDHCPYPAAPVRDPVGECATEFKVIRGGSWHYDASSARCALRYTHRPQDSGFSLGFRVALPAAALRRAT